MSWLFLAVSLWGALFTLNAWRPMWSGPRRAVASFAGGWLTSELALHHIAWQALATAAFVALGALSQWPGQLGLAITLASWAGLLAIQLRAQGVPGRVEDALRKALGNEYRRAILPELRMGLSDGISWRKVLLPFPLRLPDVERIADVQYDRQSGVDLHLDIYRPKSDPVGAPVLLQIHGGGWVMGSKNEQALPLMYHLASRGWVCVSANYRLSPHATFPEHLIDCKRALAWVREHIAVHGGDPEFVVVTGGSAGGHLAAMVALTQNDPEYQPGFEEVDTSVRGCVPFYGVYDFTDRNETFRNDGISQLLEERVMKGSRAEKPEEWERASPIARINEQAPPLFAIHGQNDTLVPVGEARRFVEALAEKSPAPVAYAELPGAQHAFELFPSVRTLHVLNGVDRFLSWLYSRYLVSRRGLEAGRLGEDVLET